MSRGGLPDGEGQAWTRAAAGTPAAPTPRTSRYRKRSDCCRVRDNGDSVRPIVLGKVAGQFRGYPRTLDAPRRGCRSGTKGGSSGRWDQRLRAGSGNGCPRGQRPHAGAHREVPAGQADRVQQHSTTATTLVTGQRPKIRTAGSRCSRRERPRCTSDCGAYQPHLRPEEIPAPAHTVSEASPLRKFHGPGRDSRNVARGCCTISGAGRVGCVAARGVPAWPGLPRHGLPSRRLPRPAPRARHARAQGRAREQRGCRAGGHRACLGTCLAGLARRWPRRVRAHPAHRGRVPAVTRGKRDRQVASACGVVVGMLAVLGLLPEHRPASGW